MIFLDFQDRRPIYEQVIDKIQAMILNEVLEADEQLPSVRKLAMDLSINPNTIQRAYNQLEQDGVIYSVRGKGSFVSPNLKVAERKHVVFLSEFQDMVEKGRRNGITKDECISVIEVVYKEEIL